MHIDGSAHLADKFKPHRVQFRIVKGGYRIVRRYQFVENIRCRLFIDIDADKHAARKDTGNHGMKHITYFGEIQIAHITITDNADQIGNGFHHFDNIGGGSREAIELHSHGFH